MNKVVTSLTNSMTHQAPTLALKSQSNYHITSNRNHKIIKKTLQKTRIAKAIVI